MNGNQRVKERNSALETASVRTESRFSTGWLNLVFLAAGAWALWQLIQVFWVG